MHTPSSRCHYGGIAPALSLTSSSCSRAQVSQLTTQLHQLEAQLAAERARPSSHAEGGGEGGEGGGGGGGYALEKVVQQMALHGRDVARHPQRAMHAHRHHLHEQAAAAVEAAVVGEAEEAEEEEGDEIGEAMRQHTHLGLYMAGTLGTGVLLLVWCTLVRRVLMASTSRRRDRD